ncbi:retropepsin-like aspartic protease, partial [Enterobacter cloacae complex sp. CH23B]|uniref:retropepsin-like aspartic protease n=1 Tax=Enterobacter cloacae complex sp. CH23B TaxID=2511986 RepID=UPI001025553D
MNKPDSVMNDEEHLAPPSDLAGHESVIEVPVNKLGQYFEGDESNATLPITTKGLTVKGVLDGGAGVSMVTKSCWESMGRPHLEATSVVVKMANGSIVTPIGMLKDLRIKVLGHKVRQTFIVMDFSKHPMSFEMILGRPFMREAKLVHDWSKNHVYLQFQDSVIR